MFLASRRRRRFVVLIPAIGSLLFALMSFFIMRGDAPNAATWRQIFWGSLAFGLVFCVLAALVPEKTKKRLRFEALAPVPGDLGTWFYERRQQGKVSMPYYFAAHTTSENLYLSNGIAKNLLATLAEAHAQQRLAPMLDEQFMKSVSKQFDKIASHTVTSIKADPTSITVITGVEENTYKISDQMNFVEAATFIAAWALPGAVAKHGTEAREVGVVRKKTKDVSTIEFHRVGLIAR